MLIDTCNMAYLLLNTNITMVPFVFKLSEHVPSLKADSYSDVKRSTRHSTQANELYVLACHLKDSSVDETGIPQAGATTEKKPVSGHHLLRL